MKFVSQRRAAVLLAGAAIAAGLSACAPLMMGGAFMGGVSASDRRTLGAQIEDEAIESKAAKRIEENVG